MGSEKKTALIEWGKNLLIVLLALSALYLLGRTQLYEDGAASGWHWLSDLQSALAPEESAASGQLPGDWSQGSLPRPVRMVVLTPQGSTGIQYDNATLDSLFLEMRSRYGAQCIPMKETLRRIIEWKREKRNVVIGFISDQAPKWNSIHHFTPFLNQDTPVFIGTEKIGRQVNAVIYFADVTRPRRGYYECRLYRMVDDVNALKEFEVTDIYMQHLEAMIRRAPQYWLWSHNRWKRTRQEWERRMQAASH